MTRKITKSATQTIVQNDSETNVDLGVVKTLIENAAEMLDEIGGERATTLAGWLRAYPPMIDKIEVPS